MTILFQVFEQPDEKLNDFIKKLEKIAHQNVLLDAFNKIFNTYEE